MPPAPPDRPDDSHAAERALGGVARFLTSTAGADVAGALAVLGDALGADAVSFVPTPDAAGLPAAVADGALWTRGGADAPDDATDQADVAVVGEDAQTVGSLRVWGGGLAEDSQALAVVGGVLGVHLGRLAAEAARRQSEERWRRLVDRHPDPTFVVVGGRISYANRAAADLLAAADPGALHDRPFEDFLPADEFDWVGRCQREQLGTDHPAPFEHAVVRLDGDERRVECVSVPFPGVEGGVQTVLRDVTQRRASEERYRTFIETISEGVWRIELGRPAPRHALPRVQTDHILSQGRFVGLNPAMTRMLRGADLSPPGRPLGGMLEPYGRALVRAFVEGGHRLTAHEIAVREPEGPPRHLSINAVGRVERDELVEIWGSCTEITDRVEMERAMVDVLEEQQERIGRDLHDSVGQLLTGVRMLSEGLAERPELAGMPGEPDETARRIAAYSAEALDRVRVICRGLVPPQLYSEGASGALAELAEHVDALGPTRCVFRHDGRADLFDPDAALQVYRIAQEAISNALRHANAEVIWVTLSDDEGDLMVEVEDDGVGFAVDAERGRSVGLYSMTRRAHSVGATLTLETAPGAGTTVRVTLPAAALASSEDQADREPRQGDAEGD